MPPRRSRLRWSLVASIGAHGAALLALWLLSVRETPPLDPLALRRTPGATIELRVIPFDAVEVPPLVAGAAEVTAPAASPLAAAVDAAAADAASAAAAAALPARRGAPDGAHTGTPGGGGGPGRAAEALALLDSAEAIDAAGALDGKDRLPADESAADSEIILTPPGPPRAYPPRIARGGAGGGTGGGIGTGRGPGVGPDLFPGDVLRGVVDSGLPRGEEAEVKAMLSRYVATRKAYGTVKAGLASPYATRLGTDVADAWEEEILPAKDRTLGAGVKRWFGDLKHDPLRAVRDVLAAYFSATATDPDGGKIDGDVGDIADGWEYGRPRGLALVGVRADGTVVGIRWLKSTGNAAFDDALTDAVASTVATMGPPPPELVKLTGETWLLYEVSAAITVLPPGPYLAVRTMADFSKPEALYPFKILVNAKADLRAVFDRGEDYDPTAPPEPTVAGPSAR
jgi:hypothetical protein